MASGLSYSTPAPKPRKMTVATPSPKSRAELDTVEQSPTLSLSFDGEDSESPEGLKLISDEEMMRLLSGPDPPRVPSSSSSEEDDDTTMGNTSAHGEGLTLTEFLNEPPFLSSPSGPSTQESQPERRGLMSRVKTMTALPKAPTNANFTTSTPYVQAPNPSVPTTSAAAPSRKRKNMSLSSPFGSLKRIVNNSRTNINIGFGRSGEPEFETVTASTFNPRPRNTSASSHVDNQPRIAPYAGAPTLTDLPPVPALSSSGHNTFRLPPTRVELNTLICQLQSQISDIRLENQVLRDQIMIVRKDWIDASQALDVARHETWGKETERYSLAVEVEKLRGEIRRLKRGSVLD